MILQCITVQEIDFVCFHTATLTKTQEGINGDDGYFLLIYFTLIYL